MLQDSWRLAVQATAEQQASISFPLQHLILIDFQYGAQVLRTLNTLQRAYMTCHRGNLPCFHADLSVPCCGEQRVPCRWSHEKRTVSRLLIWLSVGIMWIVLSCSSGRTSWSSAYLTSRPSLCILSVTDLARHSSCSRLNLTAGVQQASIGDMQTLGG